VRAKKKSYYYCHIAIAPEPNDGGECPLHSLPSAALPCCVIFEIAFLLLAHTVYRHAAPYTPSLSAAARLRSCLSPTAAVCHALSRALVPSPRVPAYACYSCSTTQRALIAPSLCQFLVFTATSPCTVPALTAGLLTLLHVISHIYGLAVEVTKGPARDAVTCQAGEREGKSITFALCCLSHVPFHLLPVIASSFIPCTTFLHHEPPS
jgi:hypothetical protein